MLSYQHAYHAGNPADLHKHLMLVDLLERLTRKPRGITYAETHAGRGLYDLSAPEAIKTGEAKDGIGCLDLKDGPFTTLLAEVRATHGPDAYPGSPLVASMMLRPQDNMELMELHPAEFEALQTLFKDRGVVPQKRDGFKTLLELSPPNPRRGLVLIDPSYEVKSEYAATAVFAKNLFAKWPQATVMIWYPLLRAARHKILLERLGDLAIHNEVLFDLKDGKGMQGSGLAIINPPYGAGKAFSTILKTAAPILRRS